MTEYTVVEEQDKDILINQVSAHIKKGWLPQGGISVSISESDTFSYSLYAQAMTRQEEDSNK